MPAPRALYPAGWVDVERKPREESTATRLRCGTHRPPATPASPPQPAGKVPARNAPRTEVHSHKSGVIWFLGYRSLAQLVVQDPQMHLYNVFLRHFLYRNYPLKKQPHRVRRQVRSKWTRACTHSMVELGANVIGTLVLPQAHLQILQRDHPCSVSMIVATLGRSHPFRLELHNCFSFFLF